MAALPVPPLVYIVVARILSPKREGTAFVNDPADPGGPTKFGITIPFLAEARGVPESSLRAADIEALTQPDAEQVYAAWMTRRQLAALPSLALMDAVTDFAVHSGIGVAVAALQRAVGVSIDGAIGPVTLAAVATGNPLALAVAVCAARSKLFSMDIERSPSQRLFASDWFERLGDVLDGMAG